MNYMKDVAKLLDLELNEEFYITDLNEKYMITEHGICTYDGRYILNQKLLIDLLKGKVKYTKIPYKPKYGEYYWTFLYDEGDVSVQKELWTDHEIDYMTYFLGLYFKTEEEATKNKDKFYKLIDFYNTSFNC